jgi:hypothetical protein
MIFPIFVATIISFFLKPSHPSHPSPVPIVNVDDFFHDSHDELWKPLPRHELEESPCFPIIEKTDQGFYKCKLHHKVFSAYIDEIEKHCKFKDPEGHKNEILRLINGKK